MTTALLDVRDLRTRFKTDEGLALAVNGVDLSMAPGETLGLVGESGCGKSVTALSIIRLVPDPPGRIVGGRVVFNGRDLLPLKESEMRTVRGSSISMIFQEPMTSLNPVIRIGAQMTEIIRIHQNLSHAAARALALEMLEKVRIPDPARRLDDYPHHVSGGMRQRVMIAMALSSKPALLIADEPTTALDVTIQAQILELLKRLQEETGTAILLITHDLGVVAEMARRVAVMYAGKVVETTETGKLFSAARHPYTRGLMDSLPNLNRPVPADKRLKAITGLVPSLFRLPAGCAFRERCPQAMESRCGEDPPMIETQENHWVKCWLYG
jgi:oligopeptide/dipeptide ABC transporter ATP-binding protein